MWDCYFEMWDEGEVGRRVDKYRENREFGRWCGGRFVDLGVRWGEECLGRLPIENPSQ